MSKRKRVDMTAKEKIELFEKFQSLPSKSVREGAVTLGVSRSLLSGVLKNNDKLREEASDDSPQRKRQRFGKDRDVETGLLRWFEYMRSKKAPMLFL